MDDWLTEIETFTKAHKLKFHKCCTAHLPELETITEIDGYQKFVLKH